MSESGQHDEQRQELPLEEVERLVEIVRESGVGEINIRQGSLRITVKALPGAPSHPASQPVVTSQVAEETVEAPPAGGVPSGLHAVRSPVVGTFYRAPAPGEETYVEVGDKVKAGQTLCIIEAMKLMNEIPTDISGEVVEVLAENAGGVEYDQPLFYLRPEG
ncbi:MAG: acetyl-CoA carboxylase biotin carboxyl carrier protein [Rubrobacteraceae bacterium]